MTGLVQWTVTLVDGSILRLWASGYTEIDGQHVFSILVDAALDELEDMEVLGRAPSNPRRVDLALVRLPSRIVKRVTGG